MSTYALPCSDQPKASSSMAVNVDAHMAVNMEGPTMATLANMRLTDANRADSNYVDLPRESTTIRWEQQGKQDSITERIVHQDEDFLPGATRVPVWTMVTKEEFNNMTNLGNPGGST